MNQEILDFIDAKIFPQYSRFYSHDLDHIKRVIDLATEMAEYYDLDPVIAYVAGAFHDTGLKVNRHSHEEESGKIVRNENELKKFFTPKEIETIAQAVEDHRGSRKTRPRNKYGEILSDADRDFSIKTLAKRQIATSIKNSPDLNTFDEHFERCYQYLLKRINGSGHFNLWTNYPKLVIARNDFEREFLDKNFTRGIYKEEWQRISSDGTIEKIKTFYLDF